MKTRYIALPAAVAVGVIALLSCSDGFSTEDEVNPLAHDADKVCGTVYDSQDPPQPVKWVWVVVFKREESADPWFRISMAQTNNQGYYEFDPLLGGWPAGWDGKVDCTNEDITAENHFGIYPEEGPVVADITLPLP